MSANNRQFPREEIKIEVELQFLEDTARTVITHDVSQGGLFMCLNDAEHYPMGEMVILHFKHPLKNHADTEKDAVVVRQTSDGIAVAFIEMGDF